MNDDNRSGRNDTYTLTDNRHGQQVELPVAAGTDGYQVIDIRGLYDRTGLLTYDPGFTSTCSCESDISFIDGKQGILRYRGYDVEDLVARADYMDVCYLLLFGDLPNAEHKQIFRKEITYHTMLHEQIYYFFRGFRRDSHPMAVLCGVVGALSAFYHDALDITSPAHRTLASYRLIAKMPTIAAAAYRFSIGHPPVYPDNSLTFGENVLHMMFSEPTEDYHIDPAMTRALERFLIVHADHEQGTSTSTVRMTGSSGANPFACIAAGVASLWGPAHGGANEAGMVMLDQIGSKDRIPEFLARAKDPNDPFRLMGFGHRVYQSIDPRSRIMRDTCHELLEELGVHDDPYLDLALELERRALEDEYFAEKKLYPNMNFYSGIILRAMGFPRSMFTALFAVARTVGWVAHWNEMIEDPTRKISRPRQLYTGESKRPVKPVQERI